MYLLRGGAESLDDTDGALDDVVDLVGGGALEEEDIALAVARKVLAWPRRRKLAHAFLWEYS